MQDSLTAEQLTQMLAEIHHGLVHTWRTSGPSTVWDQLEGMEQHSLIALVMAHVGAEAAQS